MQVQSNLDYPNFFSGLLVMIKIRSHIILITTALKSEVMASLFRFQKAKAALARVVTNEEHSNELLLA